MVFLQTYAEQSAGFGGAQFLCGKDEICAVFIVFLPKLHNFSLARVLHNHKVEVNDEKLQEHFLSYNYCSISGST